MPDISRPDVDQGCVSMASMNWKIDEGLHFDTDSCRPYKVPTNLAAEIPNATFVEAPDPTDPDYFRVGGDSCDHMLLYDVWTVAGASGALAMVVGQRVRAAGPDEPVMLLNINAAGGKRVWLKLFATGSATGALDASTPINTALGINANGVIQIAQPQATVRAYLKKNDIGTDGWIKIEFSPPPQPYPQI